MAASIPLEYPLTVYVEPTNVCNLACDFCPQSLEDYEVRAGYSEHMPVELFSRLMEEIRVMKVRSLKLYFFGEPLMHPNIGALCRLAAMACDRVELTTNLIPLTPQKAEEIVHSGIHYIRVSWYGTMENRVLKNLRALKELRWQHSQKHPFITVKYHSEEQRIFLLGNRAVCDEIVGEQLHTIASDFVHLRSYEENKKACPYPFYTMVVKSNGDVVPCCVAWDKSLVVGNVKDHSLAELWNSPRMEEIRKTHLRGERSSLSSCVSCDTIFNCPDSVDSVSASEYESRRYNEKEGKCGSD